MTSSRDGNTYSGFMVGSSPFNRGNKSTNVPTEIIPVIVVTQSVATGVDQNGILASAPGQTKFNPTAADNSCLVSPNNVASRLVQQSPIIRTADFNFGGTDVGRTQAIDAFQRANFWAQIGPNYHVLLNPVQTFSPVVLSFDAGQGISLPSSLFGACGPVGIVDINALDAQLVNNVIPSLAKKGVNSSTFPIFLFYNVGFSIGDPLNLGNCCALGYHSAFLTPTGTVQTYSPSDFDTTGLFGPSARDTTVMSHEVAEWMDDPFGFNPTPAWGHTGQVGGCQDNLEDGDPLTDTEAPRIAMPNGFTYHLQELAFFSWFYGAPSTGVHGWFSDNGTFLSDAGVPCQ